MAADSYLFGYVSMGWRWIHTAAVHFAGSIAIGCVWPSMSFPECSPKLGRKECIIDFTRPIVTSTNQVMVKSGPIVVSIRMAVVYRSGSNVFNKKYQVFRKWNFSIVNRFQTIKCMTINLQVFFFSLFFLFIVT